MTPTDRRLNRGENFDDIRPTQPTTPENSPTTLINRHFDFLYTDEQTTNEQTTNIQTTTNELDLLVLPTRRRQRPTVGPRFHRQVQQLLERYLRNRHFLDVTPTNEIERFTVNLAEDLEDKENIRDA